MSEPYVAVFKDPLRGTVSVIAWPSTTFKDTDKHTGLPNDFPGFARVKGTTVTDQSSHHKWSLYRRPRERALTKGCFPTPAWSARLTHALIRQEMQTLAAEDREMGEQRIITCGDDHCHPDSHEFWILHRPRKALQESSSPPEDGGSSDTPSEHKQASHSPSDDRHASDHQSGETQASGSPPEDRTAGDRPPEDD